MQEDGHLASLPNLFSETVQGCPGRRWGAVVVTVKSGLNGGYHSLQALTFHIYSNVPVLRCKERFLLVS